VKWSYQQELTYSIVWSASVLLSCSWPFRASTLHVIGVLTGSVCGHSGRDDFTTQARLIYVGKTPRAPTESVERIRSPSTKPVMANQQLRPPTDRRQGQLQRSVQVDDLYCLLYGCFIIVWSLYHSGVVGKLFSFECSGLRRFEEMVGTLRMLSQCVTIAQGAPMNTHQCPTVIR